MARGYKSLWHAMIEDETEADAMLHLTDQVIDITEYIRQRRLSIARAAKYFNVTTEEISLVKSEKISQIDPELVAAMHRRLPGDAANEPAKKSRKIRESLKPGLVDQVVLG